MDYATAATHMQRVHLRKDWSLQWFPGGDNTMLCQIRGLVDDSGAYPAYRKKSVATGGFVIKLDDVATVGDLLRIVLDNLILMAMHEEREFLRYGPTWVAPFHPHTDPGNKLWASTQQNSITRALTIKAD